jgi:hypothetical protein
VKIRTLYVTKVIVMVWGLSTGIVSAEDIEVIDQQVNQLKDILVSATRVDAPLYEIPAAIGVVDSTDIGLGKQKLGLDESFLYAKSL